MDENFQDGFKLIVKKLTDLIHETDNLIEEIGMEDYLSTTGMEILKQDLEFHINEGTFDHIRIEPK